MKEPFGTALVEEPWVTPQEGLLSGTAFVSIPGGMPHGRGDPESVGCLPTEKNIPEVSESWLRRTDDCGIHYWLM